MMLDELIKKHSRYPEGEHPVYDNSFKENLKQSFVTDGGTNFNPMQGPLFNPDDIREIEAVLEYEYADDNEPIPIGWKDALSIKLTKAEEARADCEEAHYRLRLAQKKAINVGTRPPKGPTADELEAYAAFDIIQIEEGWLKNRIQELKQEQENAKAEERRQRMRRDGLGRSSKISYETGKGHIDHQLVAPLNGDGIICILDPMSPYNGMSVLDYREFIIPAYRQAVAKLEEVREDRYRELRREWILAGAEPRDEPQRSTNRIRASFPQWPKGVPNHLVEKGLVAKENLPKRHMEIKKNEST